MGKTISRTRYLWFIGVLAVLLVFCWVAVAAATDLSIPDLETRLDANGGTLNAYMMTVMKGSTPERVDLEIVGVTAGFQQAPASLDSLILFRSSDPKLTAIGGIAEGMSGSPIYLSDTGELVGALSYGDIFTKDNFGLATPIAAMRECADYPASHYIALDVPVTTSDGIKKTNVIITSTPEAYESAATNGTAIVATPLQSMFISGINTNSAFGNAYKNYLEKKGVSLVSMSGASGSGSSYNAPFVPGGSLAALFTNGDLSIGAIGTVTDVQGSKTFAFGHPMAWSGDSGIFMANAWIDGIWPSDISPYKLARVATTRGTITQDRNAGIMGVDGALPASFPVTASVTNLDTGKTGTTKVNIPQFVMQTDDVDLSWYGFPEMAAYTAATRVLDSYYIAGSADTVTKITLTWGPGTSKTITLSNRWNDNFDVAASSLADISVAVNAVQSVYAFGAYKPQITAIDYTANVRKAQNYGEVVDFIAPSGGIKTGANTIAVKVIRPGSTTPITVNAVLNVPKGRPLGGTVSVTGSADGGASSDDPGSLFDEGASSTYSDTRSVAKMISDIQQRVPNDQIIVSYQTEKAVDSVKVSVPYYALGYVEKGSSEIDMSLKSTVIAYNGTTTIYGEVFAPAKTLKLYQLVRGATAYTYVKDIPVKLHADDSRTFSVSFTGLKQNTRYLLRYMGDQDTMPTSAALTQYVRAAVTLTPSATTYGLGKTATFTAQLYPTKAPGVIRFQVWNGKAWVTVANKTPSSTGKATLSWTVVATPGTLYVRACFIPDAAGSTNATSPWVKTSVKYVK